MKNIKKILVIGVLVTASLISIGCGKSDNGTSSTVNSDSTANESKVEETTKVQANKTRTKTSDFKQGETLGTIGMIDLDENSLFPKAGFIEAGGSSILGFDENKGERATCSFKQECVDKRSAEEIWHVEYSEDLERIPDILKGLTLIWDSFFEDGRMYKMYSEQQYEVIVDNTEKINYSGVDFIKEEGHIDITRKDPSNTYDPELVRTGYIAYYYFSPEGAGSSAADDVFGYGMGMAVWLIRPADMSNTEEAKTMEENYEKLKKSSEASMNTLTSYKIIYGSGK